MYKEKGEKIELLKAAIAEAEKSLEFIVESRRFIITFRIRLGLLYEELGILTQNERDLNQAREIFLNLTRETSKGGFPYHLASIYEYLARIEDRMGNYSKSAYYYKESEEAHVTSLDNIKFKPLKSKLVERRKYVNAWNLIELAKDFSKMEDHMKSKALYIQASQKLTELKSFKYEAKYYKAWNLLENAEYLSKREEHEEAIVVYENSLNTFKDAEEELNLIILKSNDSLKFERVSNLIKIAKIRINYCTARINLEKGRILAKTGENLKSAEKFSLAASQFSSLCKSFKRTKEQMELEVIFYLCKAWENMELAENSQDSERFFDSADLFKKASVLNKSSKTRLLAEGNAYICLALEKGCKFDQSIDIHLFLLLWASNNKID